VSDDALGSRLPAAVGRRYSVGDAEMPTTRCYKFIQVSVIAMLLWDIGHEAGGTFARHSPHMVMCQSDFHSTVLRGVVTEQQCNLFHEHHCSQVTSTMARRASHYNRDA